MKTSFRLSAILFSILCIVTFSLSGCAGVNRTARRPGPNGTTPDGRNLVGDNMPGADPYYQRGGRTIGGNQDAGFGNNPPNVGMDGTPAPDNVVPGPNNAAPLPGTTGTQVTQQQMSADRVKAESIRNQLNGMREIRNSNVIVMGDTALIGYSSANTTRDPDAVRNMVVNRVRQVDNTIVNVHTSDSDEIRTRMTQLSNDIANNRPANDVGTRFNQLVQSINPVR